MLKLKDIDELYFSIGSYKVTVIHLLNLLNPKDEIKENSIHKNISLKMGSDILIDGKVSILTHLAKCCNPVKGDNIIGIITKSDGISIHRVNCPNTFNNDEKKVNASWIENSNNDYVCRIIIRLSTDKNKLSDIISKINIPKVYVLSIDLVGSDAYKVSLKLENTSQIDNVIKNISKLRYVKEVKRI